MTIETEYLNTDFDLKSAAPFDTLNQELSQRCFVLHYTPGGDGNWHSIVDSRHDGTSVRTAEMDIDSIIEALKQLSPTAQAELDACFMREFNIGFDCGDTWAYPHTLRTAIIQSIADARCSFAITLYPMRNPNGTPKE
jgi:hypothetical protein